MTPPVKLLTLWTGPWPAWLPQFKDRIAANAATVEWVPIDADACGLRDRIRALGVVPPDRISPRKLCDYRPAFGRLFADLIDGSPWWGWCDLDCVFGNLMLELRELLPDWAWPDIITDHAHIVNGPFTILRNRDAVNDLFKGGKPSIAGRQLPDEENWRHIFARPEYLKFDEVGFTSIVRSHHPGDVAFCCIDMHAHDRQDGQPEFRGNELFVNNKRVITYHFAKAKAWPSIKRGTL